MSAPPVELLHRSGGGVRASNLAYGPIAYAGELARYMVCPSTVRASTLNAYGRAPSLDQIREMQATHRQRREKYRLASESLGESEADALNLAFAGNRFRPAADPKPALIAFDDLPPAPAPGVPVTGAEVIQFVAAAFKLTAADVTGKSRKPHIVLARRTAAYALRGRGNPFSLVGTLLGGRDHSTIVHSCARFEATATAKMRALAAQLIGDKP